MFDADFIPQHRFLERSIGFLLDPEVALLQTPQSFINADPVMRNLRMESWLMPDEESFYRWIEPVRDSRRACKFNKSRKLKSIKRNFSHCTFTENKKIMA